MKLARLDDDNLVLSLNEKQLVIVMACIHESFATLDRQEYGLRIGASIEEVSEMAKNLKRLLDNEDIGS